MLKHAKQAAAEQSRMNLELGGYVRELERRDEELDSFTYSASHDLRAPLRSIGLVADWIEQGSADVLSSEAREHLVTLKGRARRLERFLDGLLEYSRAARVTEVAERLDALEVVREVQGSLGTDTRVASRSWAEAPMT